MAAQAPTTPQNEAGEVRYLVGTHKAKKPTPVLRVVGNLLILVGLLLLLGIGGWYGFNTWSNKQFEEKVITKWGTTAYDPPIDLAPPTPFPTIVPPAPPDEVVGSIVSPLDLSGTAEQTLEVLKPVPVEDNSSTLR